MLVVSHRNWESNSITTVGNGSASMNVTLLLNMQSVQLQQCAARPTALDLQKICVGNAAAVVEASADVDTEVFYQFESALHLDQCHALFLDGLILHCSRCLWLMGIDLTRCPIWAGSERVHQRTVERSAARLAESDVATHRGYQLAFTIILARWELGPIATSQDGGGGGWLCSVVSLR